MSQRSLSLKTMDVLAAFTADRPWLSLSEISRRCGLSLTTTHRIVSDLTSWGALERHNDGHYGVGLRLFETAVLAQRGPALREIALPHLEDLYEATHENVQLAVREGLEVVYIERIAGRGAVPVLTRVGGRFALHATGVGLVLLAFAPRDVQEQVLAEPLSIWTPETISDSATLRSTLAGVRHTGYAVSRGQVTLDALSVACPIRGPRNEIVAALSIVAHATTDPRALLPAVRVASGSISRSLNQLAVMSRDGDSPTPDESD